MCRDCETLSYGLYLLAAEEDDNEIVRELIQAIVLDKKKKRQMRNYLNYVMTHDEDKAIEMSVKFYHTRTELAMIMLKLYIESMDFDSIMEDFENFKDTGTWNEGKYLESMNWLGHFHKVKDILGDKIKLVRKKVSMDI